MQAQEEELNLYADIKQRLKEAEKLYFSDADAGTWEANWYYDYITNQHDEDIRMCVVISLAVYEIEKDNISKNMIEEVDYYFDEVFVQRSFDNVFTDKEAEKECFEAIRWCYEKLKEKGLF
ncbi:MAG: hypothetical protein IJ168_06585 [Eubacterium sp.]|nr:hypothetical protein [Eubacterium sp.]